MSDNSKEGDYLKFIHPYIERIVLACKQDNRRLFISCESSEGVIRDSSANIESDRFDQFNLHQIISSEKTLDDLLLKIIEEASEKGHNSRILSALGIPKSPVK